MGNQKQALATRLPDDVEGLKAMLAQREEELVERDVTIAAQRHTIAFLQRLKFGKKSEKRRRPASLQDMEGQGHLFHAELIAEAERTAKAKQVQGEIVFSPPKRAAKRGGRRARFPDHLPRVSTRYELEDDARECKECGNQLHEIGEESSREIERLETAIIHEIRRAKYACRSCTDGVTSTPGPDRVIDKGIMGPGFLAHVAVERFSNHMPYNRLEKKYAAEGLDLSRSVLERSMKKCAEILRPIHDQLRKEVVAEPVIFTDDTPVTIAQPRGRPGSAQGRVWIYLSRTGKHSYDFTETRKREGPLAVLGDYSGAIHADAYPGYDVLFAPGRATEVACWAHTRRKFVDAELTEPDLAKGAIDRIAKIYGIESDSYCFSNGSRPVVRVAFHCRRIAGERVRMGDGVLDARGSD